MEPAGRANARPVGTIRGARIHDECEDIWKGRVFSAQVLVRYALIGQDTNRRLRNAGQQQVALVFGARMDAVDAAEFM